MKKIIFYCFFLSITNVVSAQWTIQNVESHNGTRIDDVFFVNDTLGWLAGGGSGVIYKTIDAGLNWTISFQSGDYLRCIEFATPELGFCGTLDNRFYKTTDGGDTWVDIAQTISPVPEGICGLSAPSSNVIYGCGIWSNPAYVVKSTDGGENWISIDMSEFALSLVDIHFINDQEGFVVGRANPISDGGIILYTDDGGETWSVVHKTLVGQDYVWKIQSPDGSSYFASVQSAPSGGNVRMLKSEDIGQTWETIIVSQEYTWVQTVGFLTPLKGWTGGEFTLYKTEDGGTTWQQEFFGDSYNRFFKVNDYTGYLSGTSVYKFVDGDLEVAENVSQVYNEIHSISVSPNPASTNLNVEIDFSSNTQSEINLITTEGKVVKSIFKGMSYKGLSEYSISLEGISPQTLFLTLNTNEGLYYRKLLVE